MRGINISENCHVVNLIPPVDINAAAPNTTGVVSMENWSHATIIIPYGATNANPGDITVEACDNMTPTTHPDLAFRYYVELTAAGDVLDTGPTTVTAATGVDGDVILGATDNVMVVIEIDSDELPSGYVGFRLNLGANSGGATYAGAVCILSGGRYAGYGSPTVLS